VSKPKSTGTGAASIFDHMSNLTDKKKPWNSISSVDQKSFTPFIINRWLSMNIDFIEVVNELQRYTIGQLSPAETYKLYYEFLLETALTTTSLWYHTTESLFVRKIDIVTTVTVAPTIMILSITKNNYYPLFFNSLICVGYFYMSVSGTMKDHFLYVHIPALMSQLSSSLRFA
jgi:hypothetical protein